MVITGWIFWHPNDATPLAYAAIMTGHLWALAGLLWARNHRW